MAETEGHAPAAAFRRVDKVKGDFVSRPAIVLYQVHFTSSDDFPEILTHLTHAVWNRLQTAGRPLDPHIWPEIFRILRQGFRGRLSRAPACLRCRPSGPQQAGQERYVYILGITRSPERFLRALACALGRRLPGLPVPALRREAAGHVLDALRKSLDVTYLCEFCPANETLTDRRLWPREVEKPWRRYDESEAAAAGTKT